MNSCLAWLVILITCIGFLYVCAIAGRILPVIAGYFIILAIISNPHKEQ